MIEGLVEFAHAAFARGEGLASQYGETVLFLTLGIVLYTTVFGTLYNYLSRRVLYEFKHDGRSGISGLMRRFGASPDSC